MSHRLFPDDVLFLQRLLSCCGLYHHRLDGDYGPRTDAAEAEFEHRCEAIAEAEGRFDARSEGNIRSLQLDAQELARSSLAAIRRRLAGDGMDARIISGTRTYAEQNALYRQGRGGNPGNRVTNARGGQSWHNFGLAWDIGIFDGGAYVTKGGPYAQVSSAGKVAGVEWGGDWPGFPDPPHYQKVPPGQKISAARTVFESGGRA
jgi:peptidoglycan LD-endopeptidase CwlK